MKPLSRILFIAVAAPMVGVVTARAISNVPPAVSSLSPTLACPATDGFPLAQVSSACAVVPPVPSPLHSGAGTITIWPEGQSERAHAGTVGLVRLDESTAHRRGGRIDPRNSLVLPVSSARPAAPIDTIAAVTAIPIIRPMDRPPMRNPDGSGPWTSAAAGGGRNPAQPRAAALTTNRGSEARLLDAIRMVETGGVAHPRSGDGGLARGPYQLHLVWWLDSGGSRADYLRGAENPTQCRVRIMALWKKRCPNALDVGDLETLSRTFRRPINPWHGDNAAYWNKVKGELNGRVP